MSDRALGLALALLIPLIFTIVGPYSVNDLAGWIVHGRYLLEHGTLLRRDIFSVLQTEPLIYPAWGAAFLYALIDRIGGLLSVSFLHTGAVAAILFLVYRDSLALLENPVSRKARYATYVCWLGAVAVFGERPSTLALIPLVLSYLEISRIRSGADLTASRIAKLCAIEIVWVNLHGSFVLLPAMIAWKFLVMEIGEVRKGRVPGKAHRIFHEIGILALFGICALLNPFQAGVYSFVYQTALKSRERHFAEWAPTLPGVSFPMGLLFWCLAFATAALLLRRAKKPQFAEFLSSPFFFLVLNGFTAIRNAALPFVVLLPFLTETGLLKSKASPEVDHPKASNYLKLAFFSLLFIAASPYLKPAIASFLPSHRRDIFDSTAPELIAERIAATGRTCPIFNSADIGSYLYYRLPNRIFFDFRNVIYPDDEFAKYFDVLAAKPGWQDYLNSHGACFAVLDPEKEAPLFRALQSATDWRAVTSEKGLTLFEKITP